MIHLIPILCLLIFVFFLEVRIKKEIIKVSIGFESLKEAILKNRENIQENKEKILENKESIIKMHG